ncbi:MAG: GAF domain-containing protein, partial [Spirochaetaceae bacterium]|nr:GAF domain-containing protein [Spirochaetaceae bacterium]
MFKKSKFKKVKHQENKNSLMDDIIRASGLLTRDLNYKHLVSVLVEQSLDVTRSDLSVFYSYSDDEDKQNTITQKYKRGRWDTAIELDRKTSLIEFIEESKETVIVLKKTDKNHFPSIFLHEDMKSAIALPIFTPDSQIGILILNSIHINYYNRSRFQFLDSFSTLAAGMINNALLFSEMKESYKKIESLEIYQEGIFSSMTDLLITLDPSG